MAKFSAWCCEPDHLDNQWYHDSGSSARCFWCAYSHIRRPGVFGQHFGQQLALQFLYPSTFDNVLVRLWTSKWWGGFPRAVIVCLCATPPPRWLIIIIKRQLISRRNMPGDIETENKKHLSSVLKVLMDSALRIMSGRLFQAVWDVSKIKQL